MALIGLYFLAINESFSINFGDVILFFSAFFWTAQIIFVDKFAMKVDLIELSTAQIFLTTILSAICMIIFEEPVLENFLDAKISIIYGGVMSAGVAFTLQLYGQKYVAPSIAAILMSFESIFGAMSSSIILGEEMTLREIIGCVLMLAGIFVTQWEKFFGKKI